MVELVAQMSVRNVDSSEEHTKRLNVNFSLTTSSPKEEPILPPSPHLKEEAPAAVWKDPFKAEIVECEPENQHAHPSQNGQNHGIYMRSPVLMLLCFAAGNIAALGHHLFYSHYAGAVVGDAAEQEWNIRLGSVFAWILQLSLMASVWFAYTQWLWRTIKRKGISVRAMNAAFDAQTSILALANTELATKMKTGFALALIAWCLQIPPLITPATLTIAASIDKFSFDATVLSLGINDPRAAKVFAYYTPSNRTNSGAIPDSFTLDGPRSVLTRLSSATAALGQILPIASSSTNFSYSLTFNGPYARCNETTNSSVEFVTDGILNQYNAALQKNSSNEIFAYYGYVPAFGIVDGYSSISLGGVNISAIDQPRLQVKPQDASNEIWVKFMRYLTNDAGDPVLDSSQNKIPEAKYVTCSLWNASYDIEVSFDNGDQSVRSNDMRLVNPVSYPMLDLQEPSDLVQMAYSAVFWVLCDQLVGSMGLIESTQTADVIPTYGSMSTNIEHNSLLGSNDLDYFFDLNLKVLNVTRTMLSPQRLIDKALAQNKTLPFLIEELSFNITVSLLSNPLLTNSVLTTIVQANSVNRYQYNARSLWIAYGTGIGLTLLAVCLGLLAFKVNGASHDNVFSTLLSISRDPDLANLFPPCCHGKLPLPKATMKAKLIVESMKDGGQSLCWQGDHRPLCEICQQQLESRSKETAHRRTSSAWTLKWPRIKTPRPSQ